MSTAYLFPGQGSQYVQMGVSWFRASQEARTLCEQADALLGYPLSQLCFEGPQERLNQTEFTQPAVFVVSLMGWATVRSEAAPAFIAGHSAGEFAALVAAGAMDFEDGLRLIAQRGALMARAGEHAPGGMAVLLGATLEQATKLCEEAARRSKSPLVVANDNCPGQVVISGSLAALEVATEIARELGVRRMRRLPISVAPHSPLMAETQDDFTQALESVPLRAPQVPVVMNATASAVTDPDAIRQALLRQLTSRVRWRESLLWMAAQGVTHFVEVGPKRVLSGLVRRTLKDVTIESLD